MINDNILWTKALPHLAQTASREQVNKLYRISAYGPTEALLLIEDLENPSSNRLRSLDICNMGMLVREWVEQFLLQAGESLARALRERVGEMG
jgi:hypothetical protein